MATWDFPAALTPQLWTWKSVKAGVQFRSPFNGAVETVGFPGARWGISMTLPQSPGASGGQAEAFFALLCGGVERVRMGHLRRPVPNGTMRGTPTLNTSAARGAQTVSINTTGTLSAGDLFKVGGQLFMAAMDCTPSAGVLTVPLVQSVRVALASGAAVAWDRPTVDFIMPAMTSAASYRPGAMDGIAVELEEAF